MAPEYFIPTNNRHPSGAFHLRRVAVGASLVATSLLHAEVVISNDAFPENDRMHISYPVSSAPTKEGAPVTLTEPITIHQPNQCPAPAESDIRAVTELFSGTKPFPQGLEHLTHTSVERKQAWQLYHDFYKDRQAALGIVTHAPNLANDSFVAITTPKATTFDSSLRTLNKYTALYGVKVVVATPQIIAAEHINGRPPTPKELSNPSFKGTLYSIKNAMIPQPEQFVRNDAGLKRIIIDTTDTKSGEPDYAGFAVTGGNRDTIVINGKYFISPDVITHEEFHLEDTGLCGSPADASSDPSYAALNYGVPYLDGTPEDAKPPRHTVPKSMENLMSSNAYRDYEDTYYLHPEKHIHAACTALKKLNLLKSTVIMESDYSYKDVVEDKAELGNEALTVSGYADGLDPTTPKKRAKFMHLLARMYHQDPSVVKYFALFASRPTDMTAPSLPRC